MTIVVLRSARDLITFKTSPVSSGSRAEVGSSKQRMSGFKERARAIAEEIAKTYGAEIIFTEKIGEIVSFYAHTLRFADGVAIYGAKINLHIAINLENSTGAVGSPMIFDGY